MVKAVGSGRGAHKASPRRHKIPRSFPLLYTHNLQHITLLCVNLFYVNSKRIPSYKLLSISSLFSTANLFV